MNGFARSSVPIEPFAETTKPSPYNGFVMDQNDASCKDGKMPITSGVEVTLETGKIGYKSSCGEFDNQCGVLYLHGGFVRSRFHTHFKI